MIIDVHTNQVRVGTDGKGQQLFYASLSRNVGPHFSSEPASDPNAPCKNSHSSTPAICTVFYEPSCADSYVGSLYGRLYSVHGPVLDRNTRHYWSE